jgi:hypothetical protein
MLDHPTPPPPPHPRNQPSIERGKLNKPGEKREGRGHYRVYNSGSSIIRHYSLSKLYETSINLPALHAVISIHRIYP